jgi:hypothetical protein
MTSACPDLLVGWATRLACAAAAAAAGADLLLLTLTCCVHR